MKQAAALMAFVWVLGVMFTLPIELGKNREQIVQDETQEVVVRTVIAWPVLLGNQCYEQFFHTGRHY